MTAHILIGQSLYLVGLVLIVLFFGADRASAQRNEAYAAVRTDWHIAGLGEYQGDLENATKAYQRVIDESAPLPLLTREWFRGTAAYGIARCAGRMGKPAMTRVALTYAFEHHFWNSVLIRNDSAVVLSCGTHWLDSVVAFWDGVYHEDRDNWRDQRPFVFYPDGFDSTHRWPLLIAMHGGNGNLQNFAEYWRPMANILKAVIVVPPGVQRESEITNSWGYKMEPVEAAILKIVNDWVANQHANKSEVYLTGFSQGAQASIELALRHPDVFRGAIAISGFSNSRPTDSVLREAQHRGTKIFAITGEYEDPLFRQQIDAAHNVCTDFGIPFELSIVPGMIHEVPMDFQPRFQTAWNWVQGSLQTAGMRRE